jgi:Protein of unknown function (DUF1153)
MATKCAPTDHAVRDLAFALLLELAPTATGVNKTGQPTTAKHAIGPDGRRLTLADLPLPNTKRWVIRRKAEVVAAVRGGLLSLEDACSRYGLSSDEVLSWQHRVDHFGLAGLRTTRTQFYLRTDSGSETSRLCERLREPLGSEVGPFILHLYAAAAGEDGGEDSAPHPFSLAVYGKT